MKWVGSVYHWLDFRAPSMSTIHDEPRLAVLQKPKILGRNCHTKVTYSGSYTYTQRRAWVYSMCIEVHLSPFVVIGGGLCQTLPTEETKYPLV